MRTRTLTVATLALLALAGCTGRPKFVPETLPDASAFRSGGCAAAAEATVALGRFTQRNRNAEQLSTEDRSELKTRQDALVGVRPTVELDLRPRLDDLIVAVGFVRIRADGNTYAPQLLSDVDTARRKVQEVCVPR